MARTKQVSVRSARTLLRPRGARIKKKLQFESPLRSTPASTGTAGRPQQRVKKPLRRRSSTLTLREFRKYQKLAELLIPFAPFARMVREINDKYSKGNVSCWTPEALVAMQEAAEFHLIEQFEVANLRAIHARCGILSTLTLREFRKYQKRAELLIPFAPFARMVREISDKVLKGECITLETRSPRCDARGSRIPPDRTVRSGKSLCHPCKMWYSQWCADAGFSASSFMVTPTVVPTSPFQPTSPKSVNYTSTQIFEETNNFEDTSAVFGSGVIKSDNSEEPELPVAEMEYQKQDNGHIIDVMSKTVNCQDYHIILRKDLTNTEVRGTTKRIMLPKKDAETNLPDLKYKGGLILEMDDFELPAVWKFKYRSWFRNKPGRRYYLETTGEFFKRHGLQAKDILVIYKNKKSGRYVARAVKAEDIQVPECECIKAGNLSEECGFAVSPSDKKIIV